MKKRMMIFALLMTLGVVGRAQDATPRANTRERAQRARIHEGRKDGELTNREAVALNSEQRRVKRSELRVVIDNTKLRPKPQCFYFFVSNGSYQ